ncbi:MAG: putative beta-lysine N-acetyltransferase [Spirochaetales bacterium]|nr:putative beta-lysine N-acetyltransferase [Spirochaetales bacterium]
MMKIDEIVNFNGAQIQHGSLNNRIYLIKIFPPITDSLPEKLIHLAQSRNYTKIFGKIPSSQKKIFEAKGYIEEAVIPDFFNNNESVHFMSYFLAKARSIDKNQAQIENNIKIAETKAREDFYHQDNGFDIQCCAEKDLQEMAAIYNKVFPSYPFPIGKPEYLKETMKSHVDYFSAKDNEKIIALSSGEKDIQNKNAEMTDFATLPEHRGKGLAQSLLKNMEYYLCKNGIKTFYTICRANSPGMNICFAKSGYQYRGTLINNTNISGQIESMNVWSKSMTQVISNSPD